MVTAETDTGTPSRTSTIRSPELTSFTVRASRLYLRGQSHCNHRNAGGIEFKWRKNPAKVIWYNPESAERNMAIPPFWKNVPSRKFWKLYSLKTLAKMKKKTHKESHSKRVQHKHEKKFEKVGSRWRESCHPVCSEVLWMEVPPSRSKKHLHGRNNYGWYKSKGYKIKDETRK